MPGSSRSTPRRPRRMPGSRRRLHHRRRALISGRCWPRSRSANSARCSPTAWSSTSARRWPWWSPSPLLRRPDAADAIEVDYDPMKAIVDLKEAASNKVKVHDDLDSNVIHSWTYHGYWAALGLESQKPKIDAAKEREDAIVISQEMINQRLIPVAIEPRSVMAELERRLRAVHRPVIDPDSSRSCRCHRQDLWPGSQRGATWSPLKSAAGSAASSTSTTTRSWPVSRPRSWAARSSGPRAAARRPIRRSRAGAGWQPPPWSGTKDGEILGYEIDGPRRHGRLHPELHGGDPACWDCGWHRASTPSRPISRSTASSPTR